MLLAFTVTVFSVSLPSFCHARDNPDVSGRLDEPQDRTKILRKLISKGRSILRSIAEPGEGGESGDDAFSGLSEEERAIQEKLREWQGDEAGPIDAVFSVTRKGKVLLRASVGIQDGSRFLVPMVELGNVIAFVIEPDFERKIVSGFAGSDQLPFSVDLQNNTYSFAGQSYPLLEGHVVMRDVGQGLGDFYASVDLLNIIWGLRLDMNYADLSLSIDTPRLLPAERQKQRQERQGDFLANLENKNSVGEDSIAFIPNDYKLLGKPAVNLNNQIRWDEGQQTFADNFSAKGVSDLLGTSADYNVQARYDNTDGFDVTNARLRMTRRAYKGDELPLGLRLAQGGDLSGQPSPLIDKSISGTGLKVSTQPYTRTQS
ncbi:MAG: hypothetical protein ACPGRX_08410, partial [Bdellovibrionales bacterium]